MLSSVKSDGMTPTTGVWISTATRCSEGSGEEGGEIFPSISRKERSMKSCSWRMSASKLKAYGWELEAKRDPSGCCLVQAYWSRRACWKTLLPDTGSIANKLLSCWEISVTLTPAGKVEWWAVDITGGSWNVSGITSSAKVLDSPTKGNAKLSLFLTSTSGLIGDMRMGGCLSDSDHVVIEFILLKDVGQKKCKTRILYFTKDSLQLFKDLLNKTPWETVLKGSGAELEDLQGSFP